MSSQSLLHNVSTSNNRIDILLEKLRGRLKDFVVKDNEGKIFGAVKDLVLDNNKQINLVVSINQLESSNQVLLVSKLVRKIDPINKSVLINISETETENLPQYRIRAMSDMVYPENTSNQVPAFTEDNSIQSSGVENVSAAADALTPTATMQSSSALEEVIRLLGERVVVDRNKRKVGEIIVRKEIETHMVQVPVRRERLIVEQINPEHKELAAIELGSDEIDGIQQYEAEVSTDQVLRTFASNVSNELTVSGEFDSPKIASLLLNAIALERRHGCHKVRVEIVVEDAERQQTYLEWFERASGKPKVEAAS